jgi:hypothetical protein
MGLKIDIPEFHGGLQTDEYLDWINTVDEVSEFKQVPEDKRVALVATRLRGRAGAWWQQVKKTRALQGKGKITCWDKMKKTHALCVFTIQLHTDALPTVTKSKTGQPIS